MEIIKLLSPRLFTRKSVFATKVRNVRQVQPRLKVTGLLRTLTAKMPLKTRQRLCKVENKKLYCRITHGSTFCSQLKIGKSLKMGRWAQ